MKCDHCDNEATIHELTIRSGKKVEKHLCERCAQAQGMEVQPSIKVGEFLQKLVMSPAEPVVLQPREAGLACGGCGTTFAEFRQSGLLGCAACYRAFEAKLGPLLERAHEGASHHVGKVPRRALQNTRAAGGPRSAAALLGGSEERAQRTAILRKQLDEAVASEQYERAAKIRDELRRLGTPGATAGEVAE